MGHPCQRLVAPGYFGASWHLVHRRFTKWSTASMWAKLYRVLLDKLSARGELDWSRCALRLRQRASDERGELTRPNPADRGKKGSKIHLITERTGLPSLSRSVLPTSTTALRWNRWWAAPALSFPPRATPPLPRQAPRTQGLRLSGLAVLRARPPEHHSPHRPSRHRLQPAARTPSLGGGAHILLADRAGCRRSHRRYERRADHFASSVAIAAAALICYHRLAN